MDTPLHSTSKLSYERNFDDTVVRTPLLFRLHSYKSSRTSFHPKEMVIFASHQGLKDGNSEEISHRLTTLKDTPSPLISEKTGEAVEKHITSWLKKDRDPSNFISLTFSVQYVFWEWKRRMSNCRPNESPQDDFVVIVFKGLELRASGRAKLGTEWLQKEKHKEAYRFAERHEEVIVAQYIHSEAILGYMPMSRLEKFIPRWYQNLLEHEKKIPGSGEKSSFQDSLPPAVYKVDCARLQEALRFTLALLAPIFVPALSDEKQRADIESIVGGGAIGYSRVSGRRAAEDGYVPNKPVLEINNKPCSTSCGTPASYYLHRKQSHSLEIGSQLAGTTGDSPRQEPSAKRRRISEEERPPYRLENESAVWTADSERDDQGSVKPFEWKSKCVGILATEVCRVKWEAREECRKLCTFHGRELLIRYRAAMQRYDLHA